MAEHEANGLRAIPNVSKEQMLEAANSLLKMIEGGEVRRFAAIIVYDDGEWDSCWAGLHPTAMHEMIGILERLKLRMLSSEAWEEDL